MAKPIKPNIKPSATPKPSPGPKPAPVVKQSGPSEAKAANDKKYSAPKLTLQQQSDRSRTASRAAFQASPAKKERNKATQSVIAANKKVNQLKASANAPGLTAQQKSDRMRTLGRAQNQQSKAKANLNKITGYKKPVKKSDPVNTKPTKPKTTKPKTTKPKTTKPQTGNNSTLPQTTSPVDATENPVVSATPESPSPGVTSEAESVKTYKPATPDLIQLQEDEFPVEIITDLLFEDIGGTEILNLARHDLVSGIDIKYQQISNLSKIETVYGGANLVALQNTSEQVFSKYPLRRYQFIPTVTDDPSGLNSHVYLDAAGDLVIELINIDNSYQIEVEFQAADINDIIY
jgi:hypothetical protein